VNSTNPASGVAITVSPADNNSASSGTTSFTRTYNSGTSVTLTAPATSGSDTFTSWTGCTSASTVTCTVTMSANTTVTANYAVPVPYTLTVNSTNPASGVAITVSPADNNSASSGSTSFTRTYNSGTSVTLTAPATSGSDTFTSWTGCTSASTVTCTVTMSANTTVTANYAVPVPYTLTVNSTNPASGVAITVSPADNNSASSGSTSFTRTYNSGTTVTLTAPATSGSNTFSSWTGCTSASTETCNVTLSANTTVTANYAVPVVTYNLTVDSTNPTSGVAITVSPADNNSASNGSTSFTRNYNSGTPVTLTAPSTSGNNTFASWSGCTSTSTETCNVTLSANTTVTANYTIGKATPTVTVTPGASEIAVNQAIEVTVTVSGGSGNPTPTGSVVLTSGSYTSPSTALSGGSAQINVLPNSLLAGSDTFKATYTPDTASSSTYNSASGSSSAVSVVVAAAKVAVSTPATTTAVTDQLLGMNLASWYDWSTNANAITSAFNAAGIKAIRWPGGSWSDDYHWGYQTGSSSLVLPYMCTCSSSTNTSCTANDTSGWGGYSNFAAFTSAIPEAGSLDLALTANYGTNESCSAGGDPNEAAAWVAAAITDGITVSHMTVGNEVYGTWETDLHAKANDSATYAAAVVGSSGYYQTIKAKSSNTLVGVAVDEDDLTGGWDNTVLANAKGYYDFVEYHYYPESPGSESDSFLVNYAAQNLTTNVQTIKQELTKWGTPNTPIYVGEIGGPYSNPGKQSWSITQGLYAGQVLGEMMNAGVSRLTWWIGFGNCNGDLGNDSSSLYGWQDFGAYNVFADGPGDTVSDSSTCDYGGPVGTMSPTARAFQLFSNVAVNGESVLTANVTGDTSDVVAYAATHSGGTALVIFNRNETTSEPVEITVSGQTSATTVTEITYDKALYDQTDLTTPVWAAPTTTNLGAQSLPLTLTLAPWSMNVLIIQ
jgi:hypothetical protein